VLNYHQVFSYKQVLLSRVYTFTANCHTHIFPRFQGRATSAIKILLQLRNDRQCIHRNRPLGKQKLSCGVYWLRMGPN